MTFLPFDQSLPTYYLSSCLNNTSATYKYYWLLAILDSVESGTYTISKKNLFAGMITNAWYTVNYFNISFGQFDLIQRAIEEIKDIEGITIDESKDKIFSKLLASKNLKTNKLLVHFDKQVPHWFLSPWYPGIKNTKEIYDLSQSSFNIPLYRLYKDRIEILDRWIPYLQKHIRLLRDYIYWNLALFLQVRNPNVPDIPNKLIKPVLRSSLIKERKFWDYVLEINGPQKCIYTGKDLFIGQYHVEHFIPYSFVSHNQIWNLIPADKTFNLQKNNKIPRLDKFYNSFFELQKLAVETYRINKPKEKFLQDYFNVGTDISNGLDRNKFFDIINPLVTIASNNGFQYL